MPVPEFPELGELRTQLSEVMQKMENRRQELESELNSASQLQAELKEQKRTFQREYESTRRLLRACKATANNSMILRMHQKSKRDFKNWLS
jgi:predicted  nucleic acid-binding Zn-ribbon protein